MSKPKPQAGRLPGRPPKHGARALERFLRSNELDQRSALSIQRRDVGNGLADDRGGWPNCSNAQTLLIQNTADLVLITNAIANFVFKKGSPFDAEGELLSVLKKSFVGYSNALRRNLEALGLDAKRPENVPTLSEYLATREASNTATANGTDKDGCRNCDITTAELQAEPPTGADNAPEGEQ